MIFDNSPMASAIISDAAIAELIAERKALPADWRDQLVTFADRPDRKESRIDLMGESGTPFRIIVRQSRTRMDNFSIILMVIPPESDGFRLLRYDGSSHSHRNQIEGNQIRREPHIHSATERYQTASPTLPHDGYAEETDRYIDLRGAWDCFLADLGPQFPDARQSTALPDAFFGE